MSAFTTSQLKSVLNTTGLQSSAPTVYQVILGLIDQVDKVSNDVITAVSIFGNTGAVTKPGPIENFGVSYIATNIILSWTSLAVGFQYEIREGLVWETANYVTTVLANTVPLPPRMFGTYNFLIKGINGIGAYSQDATPLTFTIPTFGNLVVTASTIINNVLFNWTVPSSTFAIDYYLIKRNGTEVARISGTFFIYTESAAGSYTYSIQAVDIAGNISPLTVGSSITLNVAAPNDFSSAGSINDSTFNGTKTNCLIDSMGFLLAPVNTTETWAQHFANNSFGTIQDQINAGYPLYCLPNKNTGSYVKKFDFGGALSNLLINIFFTTNNLNGTVNLGFSLDYSPDDVTYTNFSSTTSGFVSATFRYVKVTITFTPTDDKGVIELTSLACNLSVRTVLDSGSAAVVSTDAGGTTINFNQPFSSVISVTATPAASSAQYVIISAVTAGHFKAEAFDSSGTRVSTTINWKAQGIVN